MTARIGLFKGLMVAGQGKDPVPFLPRGTVDVRMAYLHDSLFLNPRTRESVIEQTGASQQRYITR
jgi:hypothetical protein